MIRLAVVDDHPLLREGVVRSLSEIGGFEIVGQGASSEDAVRLVHEDPEIMLMDISMPGGGLNAARTILADRPGLRIALLTVSEAMSDLIEALQLGIRGYILKGVGARSLAEILHRVAGGETYVAPQLSARLVEDLEARISRDGSGDPLQQLTKREDQILRLVGGGLSNKEVALRLNLQEKTIKHHMTRVFAKLGVRNRTEAAMLMHEVRAGAR